MATTCQLSNIPFFTITISRFLLGYKCVALLWYAAGSLIKLVYFSRHDNSLINDKRYRSVKERFGVSGGNRRSYPILGGRLHFVKFETHKINECLDFINSKQLHHGGIILFLSDYYCFCYFLSPLAYIVFSLNFVGLLIVINTEECSKVQPCHSHWQGWIHIDGILRPRTMSMQ